jgi:hypothetical protein
MNLTNMELGKQLKMNSMSGKIGVIVFVTELIALLALGIFYINRFNNQVDKGLEQSFKNRDISCLADCFNMNRLKTRR